MSANSHEIVLVVVEKVTKISYTQTKDEITLTTTLTKIAPPTPKTKLA